MSTQRTRPADPATVHHATAHPETSATGTGHTRGRAPAARAPVTLRPTDPVALTGPQHTEALELLAALLPDPADCLTDALGLTMSGHHETLAPPPARNGHGRRKRAAA